MDDQQNDIMVSISCLTFNHESYIRRCLDGFMMQKCDFNFEILIHDDSSTDRTQQIIAEYEERYPNYIKPFLQSENQWSKGVRGMNLRFNFPRAQGKYIAMCEGDDYWTDPLKLQKQIDFLENNPEYSMSFHNAYVIQDDNFDTRKRFSEIENRDYTQLEVFRNWIVPTASMVFRKDVVQHPKYVQIHSEKDLIFGDNLLLVMSATVGKLKGIEDVMCVYRRHSHGVSYRMDRHLIEKINRQNILFSQYFPDLHNAARRSILERNWNNAKISIKGLDISSTIYYFYLLVKYAARK